ncbi:hypothetical protein GCM10027610_141940 [Dactylosporangium cerinum]
MGAARHRAAQGRIDRVLTAETITDPSDERIGDYRALTDVELRTRWEPPNGLFIAEGELVIRRALRAGYRLRSVLIDAKRVGQLDDLELHDVPVYAGDQAVLEAITGFHVHRGVLASFHRKPDRKAAEILATARRVAILEDINNHTNVGAIFRGPPRSAWTRCSCRRRARIRCTGAACGSAWARCSRSRTRGSSRGRTGSPRSGRRGSRSWR